MRSGKRAAPWAGDVKGGASSITANNLGISYHAIRLSENNELQLSTEVDADGSGEKLVRVAWVNKGIWFAVGSVPASSLRALLESFYGEKMMPVASAEWRTDVARGFGLGSGFIDTLVTVLIEATEKHHNPGLADGSIATARDGSNHIAVLWDHRWYRNDGLPPIDDADFDTSQYVITPPAQGAEQ